MPKEIFPYGSEEYKLLYLLLRLAPDSKLSKNIIGELHCGKFYAELLRLECIKEYDAPIPSFAPTEKFYQILRDKKIGYYLDTQE